jgi:hypothetical protein
MARRLREAAKHSGDTTVPGNDAMCRNIRRWESTKSGNSGVSERYKLHYCKALGIPLTQFGPSRPQEAADAPVVGRDATGNPARRPGSVGRPA